MTNENFIGALPELFKLMTKPHNKWKHALITFYTNVNVRPKGKLNLQVACNALSTYDDRKITRAYM